MKEKKVVKSLRPKSASQIYRNKERKLMKQIRRSQNVRYMISDDLNLQKGVRGYTNTEKYLLKTIYQFFQVIGESELHIENLR